MSLRPTKGHEDARKTKSPVAYARGSERGRYRAATVRESVPLMRSWTNVFNGVTMGLRPTKSDEDAKWGGPPGAHRSPRTRSSGFRFYSAGPRGRGPRTRGSALLGVFNGA